MASQNSSAASLSHEIHTNPNSNTQFQFISIQTPKDSQSRTLKRQARSHAVSRGLETKRKLQQKAGHNFRVLSLNDRPRSKRKRTQKQTVVAASCSDPFEMLAAEAPGLKALYGRSQHKAEPVFSVSDELVLQNLRFVLKEGRGDHALLSAIMLTFAFAGSIDKDCLRYQSEAMRSIRERMGEPGSATSEGTLGAILLLACVEARLGIPRQVQLHMGAIQQLLAICHAKDVYLSDGIKRAIFWSDLNSSVMTGSRRIISHTTFPELHWTRDPLSPTSFTLPPGFQPHAHLLDDDFIEVLKDVSALQCIRDSTFFGTEDVINMAAIDNQQASIQSRLVSLPLRDGIAECCHTAAYLCSAMLRCKLWRGSTIPSHLSSQLLTKLQQTHHDPAWDSSPALLAWLLYVGGAFAPAGSIRSEYVELLRLNRSTRFKGLYKSWLELLEILKRFIWSEKAFMVQVRGFWEESLGRVLAAKEEM